MARRSHRRQKGRGGDPHPEEKQSRDNEDREYEGPTGIPHLKSYPPASPALRNLHQIAIDESNDRNTMNWQGFGGTLLNKRDDFRESGMPEKPGLREHPGV